MTTLEIIESTTLLGKGGVEVGNNSRARHDSRYKFDRSKIGGIEVDGSEGGDNKDNEFGKKGKKTPKSKNSSKSEKTKGSSNFLTSKAKLAFTILRKAFVQALILNHFDPERDIRIETDISGYVIGCNVIVTRSTSPMIWTCDHSYDLVT